MTAIIVLLALVAALGVAAALGLTADSRDPEYGLGLVLRPRQTPVKPVIETATSPRRRVQIGPGRRRAAGNLPDVSPRSSVDRASAF